MGFNRFHHIATELVSRGHHVTLLTSNFIHPYKKFRDSELVKEVTYNLILLDEKGYKKNFSFNRIISHIRLENNIKQYLYNLDIKPDVIYCAYPLMMNAYNVAKYAKQKTIPFILDIQDIWPDSFNVVFKLPDPIFTFLAYPFSCFANKIYSMSDQLIAVSDTYLNRAKKSSLLPSNNCCTVYIGADLNSFELPSSHIINKDSDEVWLTYIGTLSYSYDLATVIKASTVLKHKGYLNIKIKILGEGPDEVFLKQIVEDLGAPVEFLGFQDYRVMALYLKKSDLALNSLTKYSEGSITNKLGDYLAAGLPILNSCKNEEVVQLINQNHLGVNYEPGNPLSLSNKIEFLINNKDMMDLYGHNSLEIAKEKFNRKNSYEKIFKIVEDI